MFFFWNSDDQPLLLLEHDDLDVLLNGIDWDQPLSPPDLRLPTDPDIITLLSSSSSPLSPVVFPDQPPNPLVDKLLQSLTSTPLQFTDYPATSRQESRVAISLPSLFGSKAHSNKTQSEESQSNPSSPRRHPYNSTALGTSTHDARAFLSRPNQFQRNQQISKQKRKESRYRHHKSVRRPRYNPFYITSSLTHFLLGKSYLGITEGRSILFRTLLYHHRDLWCPCQLSKYSPSNDTGSSCNYILAERLLTIIRNMSP